MQAFWAVTERWDSNGAENGLEFKSRAKFQNLAPSRDARCKGHGKSAVEYVGFQTVPIASYV